MSIVCSRQDIRLTVPSTLESAQGADAWLATTNDSCWRVLTDFHNWSDLAQGMGSGKQTDSQPPAKGSKPKVDSGHKITCSIDRWGPPRRLQVSIDLAVGQIVDSFLIETSAENAEMCLSLNLKRSLIWRIWYRRSFLQMATTETPGQNTYQSNRQNKITKEQL